MEELWPEKADEPVEPCDFITFSKDMRQFKSTLADVAVTGMILTGAYFTFQHFARKYKQ